MTAGNNEVKWSYLMDMDGVLIREEEIIPGVPEFIQELQDNSINFLVLTNNSIRTRRDLSARLEQQNLYIPEESIWTSAMATATFLNTQSPKSSAYVIGESGLTTALHDVGYTLTDVNPEFVILGETRNYSFENIATAIQLIEGGAKFLATNPDNNAPSPQGMLPATGSFAAVISTATGKKPYFLGKPNPLMMRYALRKISAHSANTIMIGDRMDTDVLSGLESGLQTFLVLTGMSTRESIKQYPFRPTKILNSIADLRGKVLDPFQE